MTESTPEQTIPALSEPYLVDIAVNLTDGVFRGVDYKGKRVHEDDFELVLSRAAAAGVGRMIVTGTSLEQSERAVALCRRYPHLLRCTVGVHPAHSSEFTRPPPPLTDTHAASSVSAEAAVSAEEAEAHAEQRLARLVRLADESRDVVVAVGEIGIDFAELSLSSRETQEKFFVKQLHAFAPLDLPFLLHSRDCGMFFVDILRRELPKLPFPRGTGATTLGGVVHSFNGSAAEQQALLDLGLHLSVNASAFRGEELALQVCRGVPVDRLLLETDAPWCDMRPKDYGFSFVKTLFDTNKKKKPFVLGKCYERRNEPCHMVQVLEAYMGCADKCGVSYSREQLINILYQNYLKAFRIPH